MPRLIDADALMLRLAHYHTHSWGKVERAYGVAIVEIHNAPTIDAVEVVRCKDCEHRCQGSIAVVQYCTLSGIQTEDDDFCSYGERRGNDATD